MERYVTTPGSSFIDGGFQFLALPGEIRNKIYDLALRHASQVWPAPRGYCSFPPTHLVVLPIPQNFLALLRANRQIAAEAAARFYAINTFAFFSVRLYVHDMMALPDDVIAARSTMLIWLQEIGGNALFIQTIEYCVAPTTFFEVDALQVELTRLRLLVPNLLQLGIRYNPEYGKIDGGLGYSTSLLPGTPFEADFEEQAESLVDPLLERINGALDENIIKLIPTDQLRPDEVIY